MQVKHAPETQTPRREHEDAAFVSETLTTIVRPPEARLADLRLIRRGDNALRVLPEGSNDVVLSRLSALAPISADRASNDRRIRVMPATPF
ncbi:MAG: hypothetical protein IPO30_13480 [Hyphomonadaceae bacterium]|nr:hypothetical protein [Hyphomonadaceae bacterium]